MACALIDRYRIEYHSEGPPDAPVLVLSHSLGTNLHMWRAQATDFKSHLRVVRYDTRGHGRSSVTPGPYTITQLAAECHRAARLPRHSRGAFLRAVAGRTDRPRSGP